jgi:hypothetical protein
MFLQQLQSPVAQRRRSPHDAHPAPRRVLASLLVLAATFLAMYWFGIDLQAHPAFYVVESAEGHWTAGQGFLRRG